MTRPLLLDLFCGAGGAATGYHRAGFDVIGVDINPQPDYPFEFIQADAVDWLNHGPWRSLANLSAIHASPPCQHHTALAKGNNGNQADYPELIAPTRELLKVTGLPYMIENVPGSTVRRDIVLCGEMFGLAVIRHRWFESNITLTQPPHKPHRGRVAGMRHGEWFTGPYFQVYGTGGGKGSLQQWRDAMDMPWCQTKPEIAEAIPPAYTQHIGAQLLENLSDPSERLHL